MPFIYLACPYTASTKFVQSERFRIAAYVAAELMKQGKAVYAPTVYGHALEARTRQAFPHDLWMAQMQAILPHASHLYVVTIPGWRESEGVREEVYCATKHGIPVVGCDMHETCEPVSGWIIRKFFGC